jgi:enoyl-CoA hydratase/carnithine racemase
MSQSSPDYFKRYQFIRFRREAGILEMAVHTNGDSLRWGPPPHDELRRAFNEVAEDRENRVVIFTGTGEEFSGPICSSTDQPIERRMTPSDWDPLYWGGKHLQLSMLNIEVPMIAAINGPAYRHMELPLLCDIVLASDTAVFVDSGHFVHGNLVPGDGINVVTQWLMGPNRSRYFHLTGQQLSAQEAKDYGLVNEVLPKSKVLERAWQLAREIGKKPLLQLRYSRAILTQPLKSLMHELVGYGLALEGLALTDPSAPFSKLEVK